MAKSPMMLQYLEIKKQYPDGIVMWRLGDFFEMFFEDAKTASRELELTLTGRDCGEAERAPMCGVPYHAVDSYITRLVSKGYKVVICEQMEDPATATGIVNRDVVRVVTPGTLTGANLPQDANNNYLCSVFYGFEAYGVCFCDISTGEFFATEFSSTALNRVIGELGVYAPAEVIVNFGRGGREELFEYLEKRLACYLTEAADAYSREDAFRNIISSFGGEAAGKLKSHPAMACAAGTLLEYISRTQRTAKLLVKTFKTYTRGETLEMDLSTRRSLELCETMRSKEKRGSLLGVLDNTQSAPGSRMLRRWVESPLINCNEIERRLDAVEELADDFVLRSELADILREVMDIERLLSKLVYKSALPRDLCSIASTLEALPKINDLLSNVTSRELVALRDETDELADLCALIRRAIVDEPPFSAKEGGFIKKGYNEDVDDLNFMLYNGTIWRDEIEQRERKRTGSARLKIGYNRVFGYYIEVPKQASVVIPDEYIRRQTLSNAERYITTELKNFESKVLSAGDRRDEIEYGLFLDLCDLLSEPYQVQRLQSAADALAKLDCYVSLARVACDNRYVRPEVDYSDVISITNGRHPVVECFTSDTAFVPNDTNMDTSHNRVMLITGPNMAGKSTYMRQSALICLMAQIGSFVPADSARIGICDKIFTRVGASDDLASGQSTFMLEMTEVAHILKNATRRSFIIYDEIGRGTSTYDGMSIARSTVEYTCQKIKARTMFATHYHELIDLEDELEGVVNYNIAAKKTGDTVRFLRKIVRGHADESYGIEVAGLAGVPAEVIKRSRKILAELESKVPAAPREKNAASDEITFEDIARAQVTDKLKNLDPNLLTPIEALTLLNELHNMLM